jgi:hypothetical protein
MSRPAPITALRLVPGLGGTAAYSLRDPAQLVTYRMSNSRPQAMTYDPAADRDGRAQDAAKIVVPADKVSLPNQVRVPIPTMGDDSLFVTWDVWLGKEFTYGETLIERYKAWQFASPKTRIWTEVRLDFAQAANRFTGAIACVDVRSYGQLGATLGPNVTKNLPLSPQAQDCPIYPETWTRLAAYFQPVGEWHAFSLWVSDVDRDPMPVIDRLLLTPNRARGASGWESFWWEFNTSSGDLPATRRPLVAYGRNVVMLRGVRALDALLERPTKGA